MEIRSKMKPYFCCDVVHVDGTGNSWQSLKNDIEVLIPLIFISMHLDICLFLSCPYVFILKYWYKYVFLCWCSWCSANRKDLYVSFFLSVSLFFITSFIVQVDFYFCNCIPRVYRCVIVLDCRMNCSFCHMDRWWQCALCLHHVQKYMFLWLLL